MSGMLTLAPLTGSSGVTIARATKAGGQAALNINGGIGSMTWQVLQQSGLDDLWIYNGNVGNALSISAANNSVSIFSNLGVGKAPNLAKLDVLASGSPGVGVSGNTTAMTVADFLVNRAGTADPNAGRGSSLQMGNMTANTAFLLQEYQGSLQMMSATNSVWSERFRLGAAGQFGVGGENYGTAGQVLTSGGAGAAPSWGAASISAISEATMVGPLNIYNSGYSILRMSAPGGAGISLAVNGSGIGGSFSVDSTGLQCYGNGTGGSGATIWRLNSSNDFLLRLNTVAPSITVNGFMVVNLISNTSLRFSVRCLDGVTRSATMALS